jgi:hypothetical protein
LIAVFFALQLDRFPTIFDFGPFKVSLEPVATQFQAGDYTRFSKKIPAPYSDNGSSPENDLY